MQRKVCLPACCYFSHLWLHKWDLILLNLIKRLKFSIKVDELVKIQNHDMSLEGEDGVDRTRLPTAITIATTRRTVATANVTRMPATTAS